DPATAQRASFTYAQALQRARSGDVSGALAAAAQAQAEVNEGAAARSLRAGAAARQGHAGTAPFSPSGVTPPTNGVPIVDNAGAVVSPDLLAARNEILLVSQLSHGSLNSAKAHYRAALGAYHSGNGGRSRREAQAAFDAAAEALSPKK
ncbi:MAG: hypothetical protein M3R44_00910, partial [Candidatus Eremiobacteraeota bacterium]|nr:hypothetical protein [Candidatus Eremiobacteraeota bacterium]